MESIEEHNIAKKELDELKRLSTSDEWFPPKIKVLEEVFRMHVEEEESDLFKKAKRLIGKEQAQEMGVKFEQNKQQMMGTTASSQKR